MVNSRNLAILTLFVVVSEEAVAGKDKVTENMNILIQEKAILQESVDALQMDKTEMQKEKGKVGQVKSLQLENSLNCCNNQSYYLETWYKSYASLRPLCTNTVKF